MKTILVTGSNGLLGQKLVYGLAERKEVRCIAVSRGANRLRRKEGYIYNSAELSDKDSLKEIFEKYSPDAVIHTAAMTNVDACEKDRELAWKLNVDVVSSLAGLCEQYQTHLIHLSTDFVFDGLKGPYIETDEPRPLSYYGYTKHEAEKKIMSKDIAWTIIRTIIIYGVVDDNSRSNVVLWTLNSLRNGTKINVISDQFRSPTLAEDLADACIQSALRKATGIFHVSGREVMSILDISKITASFFGVDDSFINPVTSEELNQPARRPPVTGFILTKAMNQLDYRPHTFMEGLAVVKKQLELVVD